MVEVVGSVEEMLEDYRKGLGEEPSALVELERDEVDWRLEPFYSSWGNMALEQEGQLDGEHLRVSPTDHLQGYKFKSTETEPIGFRVPQILAFHQEKFENARISSLSQGTSPQMTPLKINQSDESLFPQTYFEPLPSKVSIPKDPTPTENSKYLFHQHQPSKNILSSRRQFKEAIGNKLSEDLASGQYSYAEIINKYSQMYPQFAHKFTRDFCSKVRCGRIMKGSDPNGPARVPRVEKLSQRKKWNKLTPQLFYEIYDWERSQTIKQADVEKKFNVNRSTYFRWKKNYESSR